MSVIIAILLAYAFGLSFVGYVSVLSLLNRSDIKIGSVVRRVIVAAHFCIGIAGMVLVPAYLYGQMKQSIDESAALAFGIALLLILLMLFFAARIRERYSGPDHE